MTQPTWEIREGDVLDRLREMPDESVHCVVTSPPYWGLRDYGTAAWDGGDPECVHRDADAVIHQASARSSTLVGTTTTQEVAERSRRHRDVCGRCGARRVDQQIGLEATPEAYVTRMVEVFREVRRVLRSDGTCWVNMGDGYAANGNGGGSVFDNGRNDGRVSYGADKARGRETKLARVPPGLKPKDLIGMPWRLAFALQADGWWLRSEIIWAKPNPMPESVHDRPTKAHEQIFLLTKAARYFYDSDAVREPAQDRPFDPAMKSIRPNDTAWHDNRYAPGASGFGNNPAGRNARSVWSIATQPYSEAHFATFPEELPRRCILAGTSERGVCPECGAPWRRVVERGDLLPSTSNHHRPEMGKHLTGDAGARKFYGSGAMTPGRAYASTTTGWDPECTHALDPVPATVLDPFAGSGTTLMVAVRHGRSALGIELNPEYAAMARRRILADHGSVVPTNGHTTEGRGRGTQGRLAL